MAISAERLDELFVEEVIEVGKMIVKLQAKDHIIPICNRWLNIFHRASSEERFERNWLMLELHAQLNRKSNIGYPFTDPSSYQMKLSALKERCEHRPKFHCESVAIKKVSAISISQGNVDIEARNQQMLQQNAALSSELKELLLMEEKLQQSRKSLKKKHKETLAEEGDMQLLAASATTALKLLSTKAGAKAKSQFFKTLFSPLCPDEKAVEQVEQLDTLFDALLRGRIVDYKHQQRSLVVQQVGTEYDKLLASAREHYGNVMERQLAAQEKELALTSLRYLEVLRQHFVMNYTGNDSTKEAVLQFLQQSCQQMSEVL
ncbi:uncharacterized protein LOC117896062 [Drosophila subobscura]|uniref:uncharacterized protein LOC117896062 n=1 Tax=Drosophila subobscura TaxID=7241 RepID=UPI00155B1632|nr:uncharacterized protein LOC117896062 [Drosophila subobscura]